MHTLQRPNDVNFTKYRRQLKFQLCETRSDCRNVADMKVESKSARILHLTSAAGHPSTITESRFQRETLTDQIQ